MFAVTIIPFQRTSKTDTHKGRERASELRFVDEAVCARGRGTAHSRLSHAWGDNVISTFYDPAGFRPKIPLHTTLAHTLSPRTRSRNPKGIVLSAKFASFSTTNRHIRNVRIPALFESHLLYAIFFFLDGKDLDFSLQLFELSWTYCFHFSRSCFFV